MEENSEDELFAKYYAAKKQYKKVKKVSKTLKSEINIQQLQHLSFNERIAQMGGDNGRFSRKLNAETMFETYFEDAIDNWRGEDQGPDLGENS